MSNLIIGIDIGSSKICVAAGRLDKQDKLQIEAITSVACLGIEKGIVVDIDKTSEAIRDCVKQLEDKIELHVSRAHISIPMGICELMNNKGIISIANDEKKIDNLDVKRVLEAAQLLPIKENYEIVGVVPTQFIIDGKVNAKDPVGLIGTRLEVDAQIIISNTEIISDLFRCFNRAGVRIDGMVLQPLGAAELLLNSKEVNEITAFIDVGSDTSSVSIFKEGSLMYSDKFSLGGNSISSDISKCLDISFEEAERIKVKYGNVLLINEENDFMIKIKNSDNEFKEVKYSILSEIIEARVEEILSFVYKNIQKSSYYDNIGTVVISGGGIALLKGINNLSENIVGKSIRVASPEYVEVANPMYSNCIGIIKHVSKKNETGEDKVAVNEEDNLLSHKVKKKQEKKVLSKIRNFFGDFF